MEKRSRTHIALGLAIRRLRGEEGISQEELADRCRLDRTYVGGIERGERNPSFASLLKIKDGLGVRLSRLILEYERVLDEGQPMRSERSGGS